MKKILILVCLILQFSCSNKEKEQELLNEINILKQQLDDCQNGPEKISAKIENAFKENDFETVKRLFLEMREKHSADPLFAKTKSIFENVESEELRIKELAEKEIADAIALKLKDLNSLKKEIDDVSGYTFYSNPFFTHYSNTNLTSIYISAKDNSTRLRLEMSYKGDDWIFFDNAYLSFEGNTKEIQFDRYKNKETENSGGSVWEWIDVPLDDSMIPFLDSLAKSEDAKMRLSGKYSKTRNLSQNEKKGILAILNGYMALKDSKGNP